jgi:hypothetical protein
MHRVAIITGFSEEGQHRAGLGTRDPVLAFGLREGNQARIAKCRCSFGLHSRQLLSAVAPSCCGPCTGLNCPRCSEAGPFQSTPVRATMAKIRSRSCSIRPGTYSRQRAYYEHPSHNELIS